MTTLLIDKLKKALDSTDPISSIKEIISEYDELHRLAKWRNEQLLSGKNLKKFSGELDRIEKLLDENGYYTEMSELDDLDKEMKEYFRTLR